MSARRSQLVRLPLLALLAAACRGKDEAVPPRAEVEAAVRAATDTAPTGPGCRLTGAWQPCSVEDRMTHAGLVWKKKDDPAAWPFLAVTGANYGVGAADDEVHVFLYDSEAARRADTDKLDSLAVAPKGEHRTWKVMPLLVTSNNLAALVFTRNERSQERIALALSAGLPQPK